MVLHNRINGQELKKQMLESKVSRTTISFYKYHLIEDVAGFRNKLYSEWNELGVLGRIYVASEGINAQLSVPDENLDRFKQHLESIEFLKGIRLNIALSKDDKSFFKLSIKTRKKIVADGIEVRLLM